MWKKVIEYQDVNQNSPTYGSISAVSEVSIECQRPSPAPIWILIGESCEYGSDGLRTGNLLREFQDDNEMSSTYGQISSTTEHSEECEASTTDPVWVNTGENWCEQDSTGAYTGYLVIEQYDKNPFSPSYMETREIKELSEDCTVSDKNPHWVTLQEQCVIVMVNCNLSFNGTASKFQIDDNPFSPTYNTTRMITEQSESCVPCGEEMYRWVEVSGEYICVGTTKCKKMKKQVSYDRGYSWNDVEPAEYQAGDAIETHSTDCGYVPPTPDPIYRWVDDGDNFICSGTSGYDKYQQEKEQVSYNDGQTWQDVSPAVYQCGELIEANSEDCGYIPPTPDYKARLTLTGGTTVDIPWNGSTELVSGETKQYSASTVSSEISIGVTSIGNYAFYQQSNLSSVTIPNSVTSIGHTVFLGCSSLTSVTIPNSVTSIEKDVFRGCSGLTSITLSSGITSIGNCAFMNCSSLTSVTIPNSVTSIGEDVFNGCRSLSSITLSSGITSIGRNAFQDCTSITSITIPSGVTSIESQTFDGCSNLTNITIPSGVTSIGLSAFGSCRSLSSITIPSGVTNIGQGAFGGCSGLTSITIPSGVTSIEYSTFGSCTSLSSITIPDSVTSIGLNAFEHCSGLTSVILGSGLTSIGDNVFYECSSLAEITCNRNTAPTISANTFKNLPSTGTLYVPSGSNYSTWIAKLPNWTIQYI